MIEELARAKAYAFGLPVAGRNLTELVRAIQSCEGYEPCFDRGRLTCPHVACCWRDSCLARAAAALPPEASLASSAERAGDARTLRAAQRFDRRLRRLEEHGL